MQNFLDNFNTASNRFTAASAMPRQAGYWIESYATKIALPAAGGNLDVLLQAKRGNSRPDVILQFKSTDIAWLDITSSASEGHIYDKNSIGWLETPYVTEVTYQPLKIEDLNLVSIPDKNSKDIGGLLNAVQEAQKKQLAWEGAVIEKYGFKFGDLMRNTYLYAKENAIKHEEGGMSDNNFDQLFSPDSPGNKFEKLALAFMQEQAGKQPEPKELAAVLMYWSSMVTRYEKRFGKELPQIFHLPSKSNLGLSWVKDVSSADGEPVVREWFSV